MALPRPDAGSPTPKKKPARRKQPAAKPVGVFAAPPSPKPFAPAQARAGQKTQRARRKAETHVTAPAIPKLKHPTQQQRGTAQSLTAQSLHRQGVHTKAEVQALPKAQRQRVHRAEGYARTNAKQRYVIAGLESRQPGRTQTELASAGRRYILNRDHVKAGDLHHRVGLPGLATVDLSETARNVGDRLAGNPAAALISGTHKMINAGAKLHGVTGIPGRALKDAIDLPANAVTSTYLIGKAAASGHEGKALHMLVDPYVELAKHPLKTFSDHPLNTVLMVSGAKGAVGRSTGAVMRKGAVGKAAQRAASTERSPLTVEGTGAVQRRQYSRDVITKGRQVAGERVQAKRGKTKTGMSGRQIDRRVDEEHASAQVRSSHNQAKDQHAAANAIGYRRRARRKQGLAKPTAAVSTTAQGITRATEKDLHTYLKELRKRAPKLKTEREIQANGRAQRQLTDALASHNEASVQAAARAYQEFRAPVEAEARAAGLIEPGKAETARLAGVKARRVTRKSEPLTRVVRKNADNVLKRAKVEFARADAAVRTAQAEVMAARDPHGAAPVAVKESLATAVARRDQAKAVLEQARTDAQAAHVAHLRAHLDPGEEPAFVSQQPIQPRRAALSVERPRMPVTKDRNLQAIKGGLADFSPEKLIEQAGDTRRLIDQVKHRNEQIQLWGYRGKGETVPTPFEMRGLAKKLADNELERQTGMRWVPIKAQDGGFHLIPARVAKRINEHATKDTQIKYPVARAMSAQWRRNVLGFNPRWLFGNVAEAAMRSVISASGPVSFQTARKALQGLTETERQRALATTTGGGHYGSAQLQLEDRFLARDAQDLGRMAQALRDLHERPTVKAFSRVYEGYTNFVFRSLNGRMENQFQKAMLGRALRNHPLMNQRTLVLSKRAVEDAANGLRDPNVLSELARQVDDMYGRYGHFSPNMQQMIASYTPFIAWTLNATKFLYRVMPHDHPVLTGLLASANQSTESWRKQHGLFLDALGGTSGQLPPWLQGSIPGAGGSHLRLSRYTPAGLVDAEGVPALGQLQGLLLPQVAEILANFTGRDWQQRTLSKDPSIWRDFTAAAASLVEAQVPAASQASSIAGARLPNMRDDQKIDPSLRRRVSKTLNPLASTPAKTLTSSSSAGTGPTGGVDWGAGGGGVTWGASGGGVTWGG